MFLAEASHILNIAPDVGLRYAKYLELSLTKELHPKSHHLAYCITQEGFLKLAKWLKETSVSRRKNLLREKTDLKLYGSFYYNNRELSKQTKLERYGDENYNNAEKIVNSLKSKSPEEKKLIDAKKKKTKLERYGDENYNNSSKAKQTNLIRYGVTSPSKNKDILKKAQQTNLKRYGELYPQLSQEEIKKRYDKFGCYNPRNRYYFDGIHFDSYWEVCFYAYNKFYLHTDISRGKTFEYLKEDRTHYYECDFLVNGENVEIKGDQFIKDGKLYNPYTKEFSIEKTNCLKENNVKILRKSDLVEIIKKAEEIFPNLREESKI